MATQIYFRRFKVEALQGIMRLTVLFLALSLPMIYSIVARFFTMFFIIEVFILGFWLFSAGRVIEEKSWRETRIIDFDKLKKPLKIMWLCFIILQIAFLIFNIIINLSVPFTSVYGYFTVLGNYLAPFLFAVFPLYINAIIKAGISSSIPVDNEVFFVRRKTQNYKIIIAITLTFVLSYIVLYYATPAVNKTAPDYPVYQQSVEMHNISNVYSFKTTGTGDDTLEKLFKNLPGSQNLVNVKPNNGELFVEYSNSDEGFQKLIIYNSTAAFALTDCLEKIIFSHNGNETIVTREKTVAACDNFERILNTGVWYSEITSIMKDDTLVDAYIQKLKD
ncbi:MAG: hypothetical protein DBX47_02425 [Clostridiales bacterium]|nr:MAG: hypothetical protein DBX47_02425 [Clostridiales bacterium]